MLHSDQCSPWHGTWLWICSPTPHMLLWSPCGVYLQYIPGNTDWLVWSEQCSCLSTAPCCSRVVTLRWRSSVVALITGIQLQLQLSIDIARDYNIYPWMQSYPLNWHPLSGLRFLYLYGGPTISMLHAVGVCSSLCLSCSCFLCTFSSSVKVLTLSEQSVLLSLKKRYFEVYCSSRVSLWLNGKVFSFYRAMHFSAKRGIAIACRLSVCLSVRLSVCNVGGLWSHRLEFFENNFTIS